MMRYLLSLLIFLAGFCFAIVSSASSILGFIDIPTFIVVGIVPFLFTSTLFGFKNMASAFSVSTKKEAGKDKLLQALDFFKFYGKITWIAGFFAVIIGFSGMLKYLNMSTLGPNTAVTLLSILYSGIIYAVVVLPFTILIKKQLITQ